MRRLLLALLLPLPACAPDDEPAVTVEGVDPVPGGLAPDATLQPDVGQAPVPTLEPDATLQPPDTLQPGDGAPPEPAAER